MRDTSRRSSLRGIRLSSRRQMRGMDIHVRRGVIHAAAEGGRSRVVAVTDGIGRQRIIGWGSSSSSSQVTGWRRSSIVVNGTGQTGTRAGRIGGRHGRVRIVGAIRLGGSWQAQSREFITGQQRPFSSVVIVPRDFSRTSGMDLRDRRELQLFGWRKNRLERRRALEYQPTRDRRRIERRPNAMQCNRGVVRTRLRQRNNAVKAKQVKAKQSWISSVVNWGDEGTAPTGRGERRTTGIVKRQVVELEQKHKHKQEYE